MAKSSLCLLQKNVFHLRIVHNHDNYHGSAERGKTTSHSFLRHFLDPAGTLNQQCLEQVDSAPEGKASACDSSRALTNHLQRETLTPLDHLTLQRRPQGQVLLLAIPFLIDGFSWASRFSMGFAELQKATLLLSRRECK